MEIEITMDYPGGLKMQESVLGRVKKGEDTEMRRRTEATLERCSHKPKNSWSHQTLVEARKDFALEVGRERGLPNTLLLDSWPQNHERVLF